MGNKVFKNLYKAKKDPKKVTTYNVKKQGLHAQDDVRKDLLKRHITVLGATEEQTPV